MVYADKTWITGRSGRGRDGAAAARPRARRTWQDLMEMAAVPGAAIGRIEKGRLAWTECLGVLHVNGNSR